ncbi:MAG TPA: FHA domain-containing protein [Anaeromyxobacter sp.]|nr:FHA domain-containing protein [Anaeromyxobacter sp.]
MQWVLAVQAPGAEPVFHALAGPATAGGSRADGLLLPGATPAALRLVPAAAGVVVEPGAAGVRVAGHAVHPGARRLLRPGERAEVAGVALALAPAPAAAEATRAAASPVLRGEVAGDGPAVVVLTGPRAGERHPVGVALTVGRGRAAALRIPDPLASRVHLALRTAPDGVIVEDLGSKNGVRVNGVEVDRRASRVRAGDEIALGETLLGLDDPWAGGAAPDRRAPAPAGRGRRARARALAAALLLAISAAALAAAS